MSQPQVNQVIHGSNLTRDSSIHYRRQVHVSYVKRETFGCIVQNMIESLIANPEDRDFYVTACKILSGRKDCFTCMVGS